MVLAWSEIHKRIHIRNVKGCPCKVVVPHSGMLKPRNHAQVGHLKVGNNHGIEIDAIDEKSLSIPSNIKVVVV